MLCIVSFLSGIPLSIDAAAGAADDWVEERQMRRDLQRESVLLNGNMLVPGSAGGATHDQVILLILYTNM